MASFITVNVFTDIEDFLKWGEETISVLNRLNFLLRNIPKIKVTTAAEDDETATTSLPELIQFLKTTTTENDEATTTKDDETTTSASASC